MAGQQDSGFFEISIKSLLKSWSSREYTPSLISHTHTHAHTHTHTHTHTHARARLRGTVFVLFSLLLWFSVLGCFFSKSSLSLVYLSEISLRLPFYLSLSLLLSFSLSLSLSL